jgi:hypothetical protein
MYELLENHFWLICGIWVGGAGAIFFNHRLRQATAAESAIAPHFARTWFITIMLPCALFWLIQLSAGPAPTPDYLSWPAPQRWVAVTINVVCWVLLLWWLWLSNGAEVLSRVLTLTWPRQSAFLYSPISIKVAALLAVLSGVFAICRSWVFK